MANNVGTAAAESAEYLSQVVRAEAGVKAAHTRIVSDAYHDVQKTGDNSPMSGIQRSYKPRFEDGAQFPDEYRRVQFTAESRVQKYLDSLAGLLDMTATKDYGNLNARATVRVGETVIIEDAPVTLLMNLEKQLDMFRVFLEELPTLDPAQDWEWNQEAKAYASKPSGTARTEKITVPVVLSPATDRHPAQVQVVNKDEVQGIWTTVKYSGFLTGDRIKELTDRVTRLLLAVRFAREEANATTRVEKKALGGAVASYLFG
jgi:hypothetical protein